jgi:hypothetical protein
MKATIRITAGGYGFSHHWSLEVEAKEFARSFYLGQDVKFCSRVLGMSPLEVVQAIGTAEISEGKAGNSKLAKFIIKELGLTLKKMNELDAWSLSEWSLSAE